MTATLSPTEKKDAISGKNTLVGYRPANQTPEAASAEASKTSTSPA